VIARNPGTYPIRKSLKIWIEKRVRNRREDIMPPQAKVAANYTSPMTAKWAARRAGYDEILLVDEDGFVAEGPTTNLFWVDADGALFTPPEQRVLLGVTRASVIDIAKHLGIDVSEVRITPEDLMKAPEVFVTGTTAGVWPVESLDGQPVGDGSGEPGPVSRRLREHFVRVTSGEDPAFDHWLTYVDGA
jgi:branched-chain amino acid aminotransferase